MKAFVAPALAALLAVGCGMGEEKIDTAAHAAEIRQWQKNRTERLKREDSWLTLIGLHWLSEGENAVTLTRPGVPQVRLTRRGDATVLHPHPSMTVNGQPLAGDTPLLHDASENGPTVVQMGSIRFNVIKRGDRYALRVKDAESPTRTQFQGLEYFPIDPKWRVEGRFEAYHPPKKIPITDVTGMTAENISPGAIVFEVEGEEYRLDPVLEQGTTDYFIIFRDETSKDTTYPAGRYVYAAPPKDGKIVVDFNKAYNPPCAFTDFATCPLPPLQNRLPLRIEAGEKKYKGAAH